LKNVSGNPNLKSGNTIAAGFAEEEGGLLEDLNYAVYALENWLQRERSPA